MFCKFDIYTISEIPKDLAEMWLEIFEDEDVKFFLDRKTGLYCMNICLTPFGVIQTRIALIGYNRKHEHKLKMKKFRV